MQDRLPEEQLFRAYEVVFETLLNSLIVGVAVMLIAAIVLIILCCWQVRAHTRRRDEEAREACEVARKNSENETVQKRGTLSADPMEDRMNRIHGIPDSAWSCPPDATRFPSWEGTKGWVQIHRDSP